MRGAIEVAKRCLVSQLLAVGLPVKSEVCEDPERGAGTAWHEPYRALFGDERADYAAALRANYERGPPPDWAKQYISSYASTHPWAHESPHFQIAP